MGRLHTPRTASFPNAMIQLTNAHLAFGGQTILDGVSWTIKPNRRIGLVGPNGAGKSTLLRVIMGRQVLDGGEFTLGGQSVGYLEQDVQEHAAHRTILDVALDAFADVRQMQDEEREVALALAEIETHEGAEYDRLMAQLERLHDRLAARDQHMIKPKTEAVLTGLGFDPDGFDRPMSTFSGGWRMRVALAQLLLKQPDVLLLDEPTNHLDIDSIAWLEQYLKRYAGTVVIVSHDRYFLDRMVDNTVELVGGNLTEYAGNYAYYLKERAERRVLQQAAYDNQQKTIAEMERFIQRFRAKATKAKQAQSRVKALERMERIPPPPNEQARIGFRFPDAPHSGQVVLELTHFSKTYESDEGTIKVFDKAGPLTLERGERVALIGANGAGKSTLVRMLRGTEPFDGERTLGYKAELTYFAQHQADTLDEDKNIFEILQAEARGQTETELRGLAGAFLFRGDDVYKPIGVLSGGERSRVALARTLLTPANVLLLDEPTNHLDIQSIRVLAEALRQYTGACVIVSHDRHFLDQIATKVWRAEKQTVRPYLGTYSDYLEQVEAGEIAVSSASSSTPKTSGAATNGAASAKPKRSGGGPKTKEQKRLEAEERARLKKLQKQGAPVKSEGLTERQLQQVVKRTEDLIAEKEAAKTALEKTLADPTLYDDLDRMHAATTAYDQAKAELKDLYAQWEQHAEALAAV